MSLLELDNTRKKQVNKIISQIELNKRNSKKYEIKVICNNAVNVSN